MDKMLTKAEAKALILDGNDLRLSRNAMGIRGSAHIGQRRLRRDVAFRLREELGMCWDGKAGISRTYRLPLEVMIDEYEAAIRARDQKEIDRLIVLVEAEADRIGYTNHRRLMALHTMAEKISS